MGEQEARLVEQERLKPMPSSTNADARLLELFLSNVEGDGAETSPERRRARKAIARLVKRLQGNGSVTALFVRLVNAEAISRGFL